MTTMTSQITSLTVVYSTVYSDADQRKHQSSPSLAFVWGFHRDRWFPRTKGQLRGKCFHLMTSSCMGLCSALFAPTRESENFVYQFHHFYVSQSMIGDLNGFEHTVIAHFWATRYVGTLGRQFAPHGRNTFVRLTPQHHDQIHNLSRYRFGRSYNFMQQQQKKINFAIFQWNKFSRSAGLTSGFGSVGTSWISLNLFQWWLIVWIEL